jgi:hypothetical protein
MKREKTANPYEDVISNRSLARRFIAASKELVYANPAKPTRIIAKLSSMPVENKRSKITIPMMPTVVSFMFPFPDPYDIADEHKTLNEAADCERVNKRENGQTGGGREFPFP